MSHAGSVLSSLGVLQYAFAGFTGAALALAYDATLIPFIMAMLLCAAGGFIAFAVATSTPARVYASLLLFEILCDAVADGDAASLGIKARDVLAQLAADVEALLGSRG